MTGTKKPGALQRDRAGTAMLKTKPAPGGNRATGYGKALECRQYSPKPIPRNMKSEGRE